MLESLKTNETFEYKKLSQEEMAEKSILGRLVGECADVINPTRNGRRYGEELWEKVFSDPIVIEKIKNKCLFGEFGHPFGDREEVDPEKIAIALNEIPKKNKDGKLIALFDILDTPCGRILKTVCDYGTTIGISSRGTGEVVGDDVDPDTYDFECFDAVIVPAVETARLQYVRESLDKNNLKMKQALTEQLNKASADDRIVMEEQLKELNITLNESTDTENDNVDLMDELDKDGSNAGNSEDINKDTSKDEVVESKEEAADNGSDGLVNALQEALEAKQSSEAMVLELQRKLAASDARVNKLTEELEKFKKVSINLSTRVMEAKDLEKSVSSLKEELSIKDKEIESQKAKIKELSDNTSKDATASKSLTESLSAKDSEIKKLTENIDNLSKMYDEELKQLKESFEIEKDESSKKLEEAKAQATKNEKLAEGYKNLATKAVDSYINAKAVMLGVEPDSIRVKLPRSYKLSDIDKVCESLQDYSLSRRKLPFNVDRKVKVRFTESKNDNMLIPSDIDDMVDEDLLRLAKVNR